MTSKRPTDRISHELSTLLADHFTLAHRRPLSSDCHVDVDLGQLPREQSISGIHKVVTMSPFPVPVKRCQAVMHAMVSRYVSNQKKPDFVVGTSLQPMSDIHAEDHERIGATDLVAD